MQEVARLPTLAERINAEHHAHIAAINAALGNLDAALWHAVDAGDLLLQAKAEQKHGTWEEWLKANFDGSVRRAQEYMYLARGRTELEEIKARGAAFSSIENALEFLRMVAQDAAAGRPAGEDPGVPRERPIPPPIAKAKRARERGEAKLHHRAELAIRTGNLALPPADLRVDVAKWQMAIWEVMARRDQNHTNVLEALTHELHILVRHADPEAAGNYLAEPVRDREEAEYRKTMTEDLRAGMAWLARVLDAADRQRVPEG
jgi:hypothetical protein